MSVNKIVTHSLKNFEPKEKRFHCYIVLKRFKVEIYYAIIRVLLKILIYHE